MKKLFITLSLLLSTLTLSGGQVVEAIIARVGDRIITRTQYAARLREMSRELDQTVPPGEIESRKEQLRKTLLDDMVNELLVKDRADRLGLAVTPAELAESVARLKTQYGIESDEHFNESLQSSGLTRADMEGRLRDTLLTQKVFARELRSRQDLSERELRERYDREKDRYRLPERAKVREIIVVLPESADETLRSKLKADAEKAFERAKAGEDFSKLVAEYSGAPSKDQNGEIGEVSQGEMLPVLDSGVFKSDAGSILGPIETRFGYHIVQVQERRPSEVPSFDAVKERVRTDLGEETWQRDFRSYVEKLRKDAFVEVRTQNLPG